MEKTYSPKDIEQKWYQTWEKGGYFVPKGKGNNYCIMIPPPNVTGNLHMGHGFQLTLMDSLVRYHRMLGDNTLWQVGTDHAGISTQMVVERQLAANGKTRHDLGREKFLEKVWHWKEQSDTNITSQLRRIGASVDWTRERFTLDEDINNAVNEVFVSLYDEGLIYRGKRLVNWDPHFRTAISDLEVTSSEENGALWTIRYPLANDEGFLSVATTRPETMLGDVAVAVHPEDERYNYLIGKQLKLPLTERLIPIVADEAVDPDFGTGCVKITPAHDFNDHEIGQRHNLENINIFTENASINENAPKAYQGLDRFAAREKIIQDLKSLDLLENIEPHTLKIPRADRGGTIIEPYLTDQWFVKIAPIAEPAISAVKNGDIQFIPENWKKTYFQWMENIQDWCISRQLWWGHRIPAWTDKEGNIYVAKNETEVRKKYEIAEGVTLTQDEDVLDTWFSSSLWPFATLGWPSKTEELDTFYPTDVLVTGFDIIFFWVARMIMMGLKFTGKVPFKEVYFTGLIRDNDGQKMSKSKGNVIDPIDLIDGIELEPLVKKRTKDLMQPEMAKSIEKHTRKDFPNGICSFGTDALRFTYCALATTGRDIRFDLGRLEGYRNFCNKIWNAARYVLMNLEGFDNSITHVEKSLSDKWILSKLQCTTAKVEELLKEYRFDLIAQTIHEFTWNEFCDWYLELSKPILTNPNSTKAQRLGTQQTLVDALETLMRLIHPFMPFITEEIWQQIKIYSDKTAPTIMLEQYPKADTSLISKETEDEIQWLKDVVVGIRNIRGEMNVSPGKQIPLLINKATDLDKIRLEKNHSFLQILAKLENIRHLDAKEQIPACATAIVGKMELLIPLAGLIDIESEIKRLNKDIEKINVDLKRSEGKLGNPQFTERAPKDIIGKEKKRVTEMKNVLLKLQEKYDQLNDLKDK